MDLAPEAAGLLTALDRHVALMEELVGLAQREQQHLIAFEAPALAACVAEKQVTFEALGGSSRRIDAILREAGVESVTRYGERVDDAAVKEQIETRAACLRALAHSLDELHRMTLVQAERGSHFVRAYANLLRSASPTAAAPATGEYTSTGRTRPMRMPASHVIRSV